MSPSNALGILWAVPSIGAGYATTSDVFICKTPDTERCRFVEAACLFFVGYVRGSAYWGPLIGAAYDTGCSILGHILGALLFIEKPHVASCHYALHPGFFATKVPTVGFNTEDKKFALNDMDKVWVPPQ